MDYAWPKVQVLSSLVIILKRWNYTITGSRIHFRNRLVDISTMINNFSSVVMETIQQILHVSLRCHGAEFSSVRKWEQINYFWLWFWEFKVGCAVTPLVLRVPMGNSSYLPSGLSVYSSATYHKCYWSRHSLELKTVIPGIVPSQVNTSKNSSGLKSQICTSRVIKLNPVIAATTWFLSWRPVSCTSPVNRLLKNAMRTVDSSAAWLQTWGEALRGPSAPRHCLVAPVPLSSRSSHLGILQNTWS